MNTTQVQRVKFAVINYTNEMWNTLSFGATSTRDIIEFLTDAWISLT